MGEIVLFFLSTTLVMVLLTVITLLFALIDNVLFGNYFKEKIADKLRS